MAAQLPVLDYGESTYEQDFWRGGHRAYEDAVERYALRRLLPASGKRLIDIGAGYGRLVDLYRGHEEVILLDYAPDLLRDARERLAPHPPLAVAASFYDIPLADGACDTVVMVRVLHHAADVPTVLAELRRILRPGGILILEHASKRHLKAILRYGLGLGPNPFGLEPQEFARLNYDFHPTYVRRELARAGFRVQSERAVSTFRLPFLKHLIPTRLLAAADGLLQRPLAPFRLTPSIILRCEAIGERGEAGPPGYPHSAATVKRQSGESPEPQPVGRPLFRCPHCHGSDLAPDGPDRLLCRGCGTPWPIVDGIYRFR